MLSNNYLSIAANIATILGFVISAFSLIASCRSNRSQLNSKPTFSNSSHIVIQTEIKNYMYVNDNNIDLLFFISVAILIAVFYKYALFIIRITSFISLITIFCVLLGKNFGFFFCEKTNLIFISILYLLIFITLFTTNTTLPLKIISLENWQQKTAIMAGLLTLLFVSLFLTFNIFKAVILKYKLNMKISICVILVLLLLFSLLAASGFFFQIITVLYQLT